MNKLFLFIIALSTATLFGCDNNQTSQANLDSAVETTTEVKKVVTETPKLIVTSFYPLAFMAEQIIGDKAKVINMSGSVDVHAYEPSAQDLVKLNQAHLVVFQGAELEPWTDSVIPELKDKGVLTLAVSDHLELIKMEEHQDHDNHDKENHEVSTGSEQHHDEHEEHSEEAKKHHDEHEKHSEEVKDHHDEHGKHSEESKDHHDEKEEHGGHDEHHHGEFDPHTWLDPILAQQMIDEILKALLKADSSNASIYQTNAQSLKARFSELDETFKTSLAQCTNEEVIISHDAYGYLADRYGFKVHAITGFSPKDEPSAQTLANLKKEAEEGITHIMIEENNIRRFADTLANETGLKTLPANPLGRGTLDPKKDFFDIMNENLNSFKIALNCQ